MSSVQPVPVSPDPDAAQVQVVPASLAQPGQPASPAARSPADQALEPSARVGEYHVVRLLAADEGGFTYLARDLLLQRDVVVSEHLPFALAHRNASGQVVLATAGDANAFITLQRSFIEAAQRHARFDHPACVPLWRCWYSNGTAYAAMPYHGGTTITEARQKMSRPPEEQWVLAVAMRLLDALESLHAQPVLHLGLCPARVAIRADGHAALLAPGTNRVLPSAHPMAAYQAPELRVPSEHLPMGAWTDLYGLAATVYFSITGEPPPLTQGVPTSRGDPTLIGPLARAMMEIRWQWPQAVYSPSLILTIDRALSMLPLERPQSVAQFRRSLEYGVSSPAQLQNPATDGSMPRLRAEAQPKPSGRLPPDPGSVPVLTDTAKIGANAKVTWIGPTDPTIAADLRETLGSPLPDALAGDSDPWVEGGGFQVPPQPSKRRLPLFAAAAAMLVGVIGVAAHFWNEEGRTQDMSPSLQVPTADRALGTELSPKTGPSATTKPRSGTATKESPSENAPMPRAPAYATQSQPTSIPLTPPTSMGIPAAPVHAGEAHKPSARAPTNPPVAPESSPAMSAPEAAPTLPPLAPASPRAACAGRSNFSLVYCMEQQCERDRFRNHPQCVSLRATGEVE